jgi:mannose-1-phosphate guanylyltransferase
VKAILLAAGIGRRLRPITDQVPKCMVTVGGKPMLDIWMEKFHQAGVSEVLVNLHHLPDIVSHHIATRTEPPAVLTFSETELLGSAGTLLANRQWIKDEEFFPACNADNLTDFDLRLLADTHRRNNAVATLAVFRSAQPCAGGVVELGADGTVTGFAEKPSEPVSDLVNAGIYAFRPSVLDEITDKQQADIGYDLLPRLVGRARTVLVEGYFRDIGTMDAYRRATQEWPLREPR